MVTARQLAANRRNAEKSTGPRTDEGKAFSRGNAVKHGLAGDGIVLPVVAMRAHDGGLVGSPEIVTRGVVADAASEPLVSEASQMLAAFIEDLSREERTDPGLLREAIRVEVRRFFRKRTGRRPLVLPIVMEI